MCVRCWTVRVVQRLEGCSDARLDSAGARLEPTLLQGCAFGACHFFANTYLFAVENDTTDGELRLQKGS